MGYFMMRMLDMGIVHLRHLQGELDLLLGQRYGMYLPESPLAVGPEPVKTRIVDMGRMMMDYERWLHRTLDDIYKDIVRLDRRPDGTSWLKRDLRRIWRERKEEIFAHRPSLKTARGICWRLEYETEVEWSLIMKPDNADEVGPYQSCDDSDNEEIIGIIERSRAEAE